MTIYKLTNSVLAIPEDYVVLCMTEKQLRKFCTPDWKATIIFEDTTGNLYCFQGRKPSVIIVKKEHRQ